MTRLSAGHRIAVKAHRCNLCLRVIEAREFYTWWNGRVDGEFAAVKHCEQCTLLYGWIERVDPGCADPDYGIDVLAWLQDTGHRDLLSQLLSGWASMTAGQLLEHLDRVDGGR